MVQKESKIQVSESLSLFVSEQGEGRPYLLLHGGAGPGSLMGLAGALAAKARVVVPTHPGFNGQPRPEGFNRVSDIAKAYLTLLEKLDLSNVTIVGNSMGGWIAAEMALSRSPRIAGIVLLNGVGIDTGSPDKKIVDPTAVPPEQRASLSFHDPARFFKVPTGPALEAMLENQKTLKAYSTEHFSYDPGLRARLGAIQVPSLVAWGASDKIVDVDYGRLFAASLPGSKFVLIPEAGHFPQVEKLEEVLRLIGDFETKIAS